MDLALKKTDAGTEASQRARLENDVREQVAFSTVCAENYIDPLLAVSEHRLRANARSFIAAMPRVRPHFAVKALTAK